jgi:hypothetical protein
VPRKVRIGALFTSQLSWRTKCKLYKRLHWLFCNGYQIDLQNNGAGIGGASSLVHKLVKLNAVKLSRIELKLGVVQLTQPITNNGQLIVWRAIKTFALSTVIKINKELQTSMTHSPARLQ